MESSETPLDKDFGLLNEAIIKAIISSKDVKALLMDFKSKNLIDQMAVLNLIVSLEELSEIVFSPDIKKPYRIKPENTHKPIKPKSLKNNNKIVDIQPIDGRVLTDNELSFEKFYEANFSEDEWLRKARLKL